MLRELANRAYMRFYLGYKDPVEFYRRLDAKVRNQASDELAGILARYLFRDPNRWKRVMIGTVPGLEGNKSIHFYATYREHPDTKPPSLLVEQLEIIVHPEGDNIPRERPVLGLNMRHTSLRWDLSLNTPGPDGYFQPCKVESNPRFVRDWVNCAKAWR